MKVLYITNVPAPYRVEFFNELGKTIELTVVYERSKAEDRDEKWKSNSKTKYTELFLNGINIGKDTALNLSILKFLDQRKFDLIVVGGYSTPTGMLAILYMSLMNIPFLLNTDGGVIKKDNVIKYRLKRFFMTRAMGVLSTGETTNSYLMHYGVTEERIFKYPFTSISKKEIIKERIDKKRKDEIKKELGIAEEKVVISVGQFIHRKGFDTLIKTSQYFNSNTGLYLIGGKATQEYLELISELNLKRIYFVDFQSKVNLKKYFSIADIFVLPTREDIWGLVINEAMAYGLPVITTNKCVAGIELINNHENGFIVEVDNIPELENKINLLLNDEDLQETIQINNIKKSNEISIEKMAEVHIEIFNKLRNNYKSV